MNLTQDIAAAVYGAALGLAALMNVTAASTEDALFAVMDRELQVPYDAERGKHSHWKTCMTARVPHDDTDPHGRCHARLRSLAALFVASGREHGIDPWVLAAVSHRETRWNPWAEGAKGESGVMQLLGQARRDPESGKLLRFYDPRRNKRCRREADECQAGVVQRAAQILATGLVECGDIRGALYRYNSGRCAEHPNGYADKVLRQAAEWRGGDDA